MIYCTLPWTDLYLRWNGASCCCHLAASRRNVFKTWESIDDIDKIFNSQYMIDIRSDMQKLGQDVVCKNCTRRFFAKPDLSVNTNDLIVKKPKRIGIPTTLFCQGDCTYCSVPVLKVNPKSPSLEFVKKFCDSLDGVESIVLTGGDLFALNDETIDVWMRPVLSSDIQCYIITNGIGLTEKRYNKYCKKSNISVGVTLDTMSPELYIKQRGMAGAFTVHDNIAKIAKSDPDNNFIINCTVTGITLESISEVIVFAGSNGIKFMNINPVSPTTKFRRFPEANIFGNRCTKETHKKTKELAEEWNAIAEKYEVSINGIENLLLVNDRALSCVENKK